MLRRAFTILLAATVIACPYLCSSGGMSCCAAMPGIKAAAHQRESACRHCPNCRPQEKDESPCDDSSGSQSCQGVCGGAVIEKPFELIVDDYPALLSLPMTCSIIADRLTADDISFGASIGYGCENAGRLLRTLHMSLIC